MITRDWVRMMAAYNAEMNRRLYAAVLKLAVLPAPTFEQQCYLSGGDDYELLFTASAGRHEEVLTLSNQLGLPLTCIGQIETGSGLTVLDLTGTPVDITRRGYDHFA